MAGNTDKDAARRETKLQTTKIQFVVTKVQSSKHTDPIKSIFLIGVLHRHEEEKGGHCHSPRNQ